MARNTHNALGYTHKQIKPKHIKNKLNRLRAISDFKDVIPDLNFSGAIVPNRRRRDKIIMFSYGVEYL